MATAPSPLDLEYPIPPGSPAGTVAQPFVSPDGTMVFAADGSIIALDPSENSAPWYDYFNATGTVGQIPIVSQIDDNGNGMEAWGAPIQASVPQVTDRRSLAADATNLGSFSCGGVLVTGTVAVFSPPAADSWVRVLFATGGGTGSGSAQLNLVYVDAISGAQRTIPLATLSGSGQSSGQQAILAASNVGRPAVGGCSFSCEILQLVITGTYSVTIKGAIEPIAAA